MLSILLFSFPFSFLFSIVDVGTMDKMWDMFEVDPDTLITFGMRAAVLPDINLPTTHLFVVASSDPR